MNSHAIYRIDISAGYWVVIWKMGEHVRSRSESLEFALLGLLSQNELHGYELRKRMSAIFGPFRALSFSVLYPQLRRMLEAGLIEESFTEDGGLSRRSRIVYRLSAKGADRFSKLTETVSPDTWEDEGFEVRFAFFSPTSGANRVRILEGRHRRLKERAEILRNELEKSPIGLDKYLEEWRRHSLESAEREIAWLEDMIKTERK
ncbi:MAG: PadR family transcriptional regulator [Candidatus Nanopelagicaceae bacterium]